jgi:Bacterial Ig-like domain (group 1)
MRLSKFIWILGFALALASCGGGGGDPGSTPQGAGGTTPTGDTQASAAGAMTLELLGGGGSAVTSLSAVEIGQAQVTVLDAKSVPISGVVVTFSETGPGLLNFAPAAATALTDAAGKASIEVRAASATALGATQISAAATVTAGALAAKKAISISSAPSTGPVTDPQTLANAITFLDVNPSDKSIVIQGAGGSGRSESATLRFRVVDKNNTPVKGVIVNFEANPATNVTLNIASATTDAEGVVVTTVSSKTVPTSVVIKATVSGKTVATQSDQLLVTTGVGIQAGFEIVAEKYNLDGGLTGDSTNITAFIVDANGNPVADGVPVVFTTSGGGIATSARGGCTTLNGKCSVPFNVQEPRNDGLALVTGSTQVGANQTLSGAFQINMSDPILAFVDAALTPVTVVTLDACKQTFEGFVANSLGRAAAAGTTVVAKGVTTGFGASVKSGGTVLDSRVPGFGPLPAVLEFDASGMAAPRSCIPGGFTLLSAQATVEMTTPASRITSPQNITVRYPGGSVFLADPISEQVKSEFTLSTCGTENQTLRVLTNIPGVNAPAGMTVAATNSSGATVVVASGSPVASSPADIVVSVRAPLGGPEACFSGGTAVGSFPMSLVIRLNPGQPNQITQIQTVTVKYSKAA